MQRLYQGVEALPNDHRGMPWLAKQALEPFYQQTVNELWAELLSALKVLGLAGDRMSSNQAFEDRETEAAEVLRM